MFNFHFSIFDFYFWNGDWAICYACTEFCALFQLWWTKSMLKLKKSKIFCEGLSRICLDLLPISLRIHVNSESFLFWKKIIKSFKKYYASAKWLFLVSNLPLNIKYEIVLFEQCQMKLYVISPLLWISNLAVQQALKKDLKRLISKRSGPSYEENIVFSDSTFKNMLRPIGNTK